MRYVMLFMAIAFVFGSYLCAKVIQYLTGKTWPGVLVMFLSILPIVALWMRHILASCGWFTTLINDMSYIYLGFILYFTIYMVVVFCIYILFRDVSLRNLCSTGFVLVPMLLIMAYLNAITPRLKTLNIEADANLRICFVSDIHVGCIGTRRVMNTVIKRIEEIKPDVILFGGDILDIGVLDTFGPVFVDLFKPLTAKYKTYAVVGNHEVYAGVEECIRILRQAGIEVLLDQVVQVKDFNIVGRLDASIAQKKPLNKIIPQGLKNLIVFDHTPSKSYVQESIDNNALLHLSGHTHAGQMFPMNFVVSYMYGNTSVLKKIQNTNVYISCGAGFWGPPYRIGNIPEIMQINIFKTSDLR